jgi:hypothetical protein
MAMPLGEESEESVNPPEGDNAVPALLNRLLPGVAISHPICPPFGRRER